MFVGEGTHAGWRWRSLAALGLLLSLCGQGGQCARPPPAAPGRTQRHGWASGGDALKGPCTVERLDSTSLSMSQFHDRFLEREPVVLTGLLEANGEFRRACSRDTLLADWGNAKVLMVLPSKCCQTPPYELRLSCHVADHGAHTAGLGTCDRQITLSTANTHSHDKHHLRLREYVAQHMKAQDEEATGQDTLYHFGDNNHTEWEPLFALYNLPPFIPGSAKTALSWGLAGPRSGVPFHVHGAGYSEPVHGRKRWFLLPPNVRPPFDPNETTLTWVNKNLERTAKLHGFLQCTVHPGEAIYFPSNWWHATLNLDESVFMSTFVAYTHLSGGGKRSKWQNLTYASRVASWEKTSKDISLTKQQGAQRESGIAEDEFR